MASRNRSDLLGEALDGRYQIERRIGLGGSGVVFQAIPLHQGAEQPVAVKLLREQFVTHADLCRRLRREAEVGRRVVHPGVASTLDEGTLYDGSPYVVMPRLYGETLSSVLSRNGSLPAHIVAVIAMRVAAILHSAHSAGYVHRDVKPEHILLNRTPGGELMVHLIDFGVCATAELSAEERALENGKVFGTPNYASPEQASGSVDVDGRADLFSLGVVMFEALSGQLPFRGATVATLLLSIIGEDAPLLREVVPELDPQLERIVATLLARPAGARFPSARALSRALLPYVGRRRETELRVARMLHATSRATDTAPTTPAAAPQPRAGAA